MDPPNSVTLVTGDLVVSARRVRKRAPARDRCWQRRHKVSSCLSKDFPWEIVLRFLQGHPRSLILLQMVDRNLRQVLSCDHLLWAGIYRRHFFYKAFMSVRVRDQRFPELSLYKEGLTGVPYHTGGMPGDVDPAFNTHEFKERFSAYVRLWHALIHGTRCGMCGCRYRHDVYWALGKRVCKLCMAQNSISDSELFERYGLAFSEILPVIKGMVFYYMLASTAQEDRMAFYTTRPQDLLDRRVQHMFWLPHIAALFDLDALREAQVGRRRAASLLCGYVRKAWVFRQRVALSGLRSIDCLLLEAYKNEKRRMMLARTVCKGGPEWAFPNPLNSSSRHTRLTGEPEHVFFRRFYEFSDCVV